MLMKPEILARNILGAIFFCLVLLFFIGKVTGNEQVMLVGELAFLFLFASLAVLLLIFAVYLLLKKSLRK